LKLKNLSLNNFKKSGYFILLDMLITLTISSFCLMMIFSGFERIETFKRNIDELVEKRNRVTQILTSKEHFIQLNHLEKNRSYEIFPGVFVEIYRINFKQETQEKFGVKEVEFGIVNGRKGE